MPSRTGQTSIVWQVTCPQQWVNRCYGELVGQWAKGEDASGLLGECGPALVLAIYRCTAEGHGSANSHSNAGMAKPGYTITAPESTFILGSHDLLTVLAPSAFGKAAFDMDLLPGFEARHESRTPSQAGSSIVEDEATETSPPGASVQKKKKKKKTSKDNKETEKDKKDASEE